MASPQPPDSDVRAAAVVVVIVWLAALAASPPAFLRSSDGRAMFATAESLASRGDLAIDESRLDERIPVNPSVKRGPDGRAYAKYGVGWPLLLAGLLLAASALGSTPADSAVQAALLAVNPLLSAVAAAVAAAIAVELGSTRRQAALLGVAGAVTTFAWHDAVSDGADPLMALLVTLSLWGAARFARTRAVRDAALAGGALGAAVVAKSALVVLAPALLISIAVAQASAAPRRRGIADWDLRPLLACGSGLAAGLGVQLWSNHARWGSPLASGYNEPVLTGDIAFGVWQLTIGPNKGLLVYAPIAFLGLVALGVHWRRHMPWSLAAGLGSLGLLAVTARFYDFGGGWTWGPRYLLPVVPALAASAGLWFATRGGRVLAGAALALGFAVSLAGVVIDASASRATFATAWLPEASGLVRSGDTRRPGAIVEQPRPVEDVLPEFSGLAVNLWLARVLLVPCACSSTVWWCACADGGDMYWHPRFRRPPWHARYPHVEARPPYGQDLLAPALLRRAYRRLLLDVSAVPPPREGRTPP